MIQTPSANHRHTSKSLRPWVHEWLRCTWGLICSTSAAALQHPFCWSLRNLWGRTLLEKCPWWDQSAGQALCLERSGSVCCVHRILDLPSQPCEMGGFVKIVETIPLYTDIEGPSQHHLDIHLQTTTEEMEAFFLGALRWHECICDEPGGTEVWPQCPLGAASLWWECINISYVYKGPWYCFFTGLKNSFLCIILLNAHSNLWHRLGRYTNLWNKMLGEPQTSVTLYSLLIVHFAVNR